MINVKVVVSDAYKNLFRTQRSYNNFKRRTTQNIGLITKTNAQQVLLREGAVFTGSLVNGMQFKSTLTKAIISNPYVYSKAWEVGSAPRRLTRESLSAAGYSVGRWMDAKGFDPRVKNLWVGRSGSKIGRGVNFMRQAAVQTMREMPKILEDSARRTLK